MNDFLNWLFGIGVDNQGQQALGFGTDNAQLTFVHALPSWGIALAIVGIIAFVWWSYRSLPGSRSRRTTLGIVRTLALLILITAALGPMIEQTTTKTEADWALVLLDQSGSVATRDATNLTDPTSLITRSDQLAQMIDGADERWTALADQKHIEWMGFDDSISPIATGAPPSSDTLLNTNAGASPTRLGRAIDQALRSAAARPISSIVIASDGQSQDPIDPELLNTLKSAQIPIFAVPLGSDEPIRDLGIARIESPSAVFADDLVPMRVLLSSSGIKPSELNENQRVVLVDHATGQELSSTPIAPEHLSPANTDQHTDSQAWLTLTHTPEGQGDRQFDIRIKSDTPETDLNASNDASTIRMGIVDRPMRVLYIDGYPRWEHRYLKNLLLRESSIRSSSMLLAANRRYVQEGDELIGVLPNTLEQWEPFDVVILGDVRPQLFSAQQLETLAEHVAKHGAGVLWIAGPSATPGAWLDTPMGALLPMRPDAGGSQNTINPWTNPVTMRSTDEAHRLGLLGLNDDRTGWAERISNPSTGWSRLQWALNLDESTFKPGVATLAAAQSVSGVNESETSPIVTMMRFGSGRSIFIGTDEIWRWRYGRGEDLPERFYLPIIRTLGRGTVDRRAAPASLTIAPTNPSPHKPTQITLRLFDQARIDTMPDEVRVQIEPVSSFDEPTEIVLRGTGDTRIATWIPDQPGVYNATLPGADLELAQVRTQTRVLDESDEQRTLSTNHQLLADLSEQTGGRMIRPDEFNSIPGLMPNRTRTITSPPKQASLWDRPIVLIVLVLLFTIEWIGRRTLRLA